ncbi:SDR family oxidoreductase [Chloroflexales bacterium ZM16-3]|nr:SDR family oxidoreductase [Chloroflexales bacterium ZM16-3]
MTQQMGTLAGKVAVITGSTQGLGLAIARAFAEAGAAVVVSNHLPEDVSRAVDLLCRQGAQAAGHVCDVRVRAQAFALADAALAAFGRLDIWVNNAGVTATQGPTVAVAPDSFTRVVETNILGTYHGSLAALRHMSPRRAGKLINIVGQGEGKPNPYGNAYGASKAWIRHFTMALAEEERAAGLGVFTLNPGLLDTELTRQMHVVVGYESRARAFDTVARLLAVPAEESARMALWLAGPATDGRTGIQLRAPVAGRLLRGLTRELARLALRRPAPHRVRYVSLPSDREQGTGDRGQGTEGACTTSEGVEVGR